MRILISIGYYNLQKTAGMITGENIASSMVKMGHECRLIGFTDTENRGKFEVEAIQINRIPDDLSKKLAKIDDILVKLSKKSLLRKIFEVICCHPFLFLLRTLVYRLPRLFNGFYNKHFRKEVEIAISKYSIDALICVVYPFKPAEILIKDKSIKCTKVYYQLDPYGTSYAPQKEEMDKRKKDEVRTMLASDIVAVTPELYKEYSHDNNYNEVVKKAIVVGFPAYMETSDSPMIGAIDFDNTKINILYCGTIDGDNIRDTRNAICVLSKLISKRNDIRIYIMGKVTNAGIILFANSSFGKVSIIAPVSPRIAFATMKNSNFLLNIGNTLPNMVPSKIFSYFYSLKPIISFEKTEQMPEIDYLKRYPLGMVIYENDDIDGAIIRLEEFINENRDKSADEKEVREKYKSNTPGFAAEQFLQMILELNNQND